MVKEMPEELMRSCGFCRTEATVDDWRDAGVWLNGGDYQSSRSTRASWVRIRLQAPTQFHRFRLKLRCPPKVAAEVIWTSPAKRCSDTNDGKFSDCTHKDGEKPRSDALLVKMQIFNHETHAAIP